MSIAGRAPLTAEQAIAQSAPLAGRLGFYFDFDGTLAEIQDDPGAVQPIPGVVQGLVELASRVDRVGIVSARPVGFLAERFGQVPGIVLYGLYGLESRRDAETSIDPEVAQWVPAIRRLVEAARHELPPDVLVEDKHLAVALHYRLAPHRRDEVETWAGREAQRLGLAVQRGRMVAEIKPAVARDKGVVIQQEIAGLGGAWYVGDDISDRRAFEVLAEYEATHPDFLGVRVAVTNTETGGALADLADFVLAAPEEMPRMLARVTRAFVAAEPAPHPARPDS
ncbi:MAG TPA: trehalose-phosphatase [Actinomycetes bacterium]|nr:trehalose-phosphatase [Actinomycetes bacterium]